MSNINIGKNIKFYRKKLKLTQEQVAESSNLSTKYISLLENDSNTNISVQKLSNIADSLGVDVSLLLATDQQEAGLVTPYKDLLFIKLQKLPIEKSEQVSKAFIELLVSLNAN